MSPAFFQIQDLAAQGAVMQMDCTLSASNVPTYFCVSLRALLIQLYYTLHITIHTARNKLHVLEPLCTLGEPTWYGML